MKKSIWNRIAWLFFLTVTLLIAFWGLAEDKVLFTNDGASTYAVARGAIEDGQWPMSGPPAARGGRHLGPLYYYWQIAILSLGGDAFSSVRLEAGLKWVGLGFLGLLLCSLVERRHIERQQSVVLIACAISFFVGPWWWLVRTPWHSNFVLILNIAYLWSLLLVLRRGLVALPFLIFSASVMLGAHLATLAFVAPSSGLVAGFLLYNHVSNKTLNRQNLSWRVLILALVLSILYWLPVFIYEATVDNNAKRFILGLNKLSSRPVGLSAGLELLLVHVKRYSLGDAALIPFVGQELNKICLLFLLVIAISILSTFSRKLELAERQFVWVLLGALGFSAVIVGRLSPPIELHYLQSTAVVVVLLSSFSIVAAIELFIKGEEQILFWKKCLFPNVILKLSALLFVLVVLVLSINNLQDNVKNISAARIPQYETLLHAKEIAQILTADMDMESNIKILVTGPGKLRQNAYYYFLRKSFYTQMQYAPGFKELSNFHIVKDAAKPNIIYRTACEPDKQSLEQELKVYGVRYLFVRNLDLSSCSTCSGCWLQRWERVGTSR